MSVYAFFNVYTHLLISHKNNNNNSSKKRIVTGFMSTELIALHKLRCYDRCLFVCMCLPSVVVDVSAVASLTLLLLLCFSISRFNSFHCHGMSTSVRVCEWLCSCVYVCIHCGFSSRQSLTHTHTLAHRTIFACLLFLFVNKMSTRLPIWFEKSTMATKQISHMRANKGKIIMQSSLVDNISNVTNLTHFAIGNNVYHHAKFWR